MDPPVKRNDVWHKLLLLCWWNICVRARTAELYTEKLGTRNREDLWTRKKITTKERFFAIFVCFIGVFASFFICLALLISVAAFNNILERVFFFFLYKYLQPVASEIRAHAAKEGEARVIEDNAPRGSLSTCHTTGRDVPCSYCQLTWQRLIRNLIYY